MATEAAPAATQYAGLRGAAVFVTGGGSGIGAAIVRAFVGQGSRVSFVDNDERAALALVDSLAAAELHFLPCDLRDIDTLRRAIAAAQDGTGPLRVLVNNAGRDDRHALADVTPAYWDDNQAVNLRHQFFATQAVAPAMKAAGGGSVICLGSVSWMRATAGMVSYTTAKAAIHGLVRTLARELGPDNIRVNCIVPGAVQTPRQQALWLTPAKEVWLVGQQALKHRLLPDDIARMALFLASDDARGCTGQDFVVDAGLTLN